jgi:Zn-dependent protease
MFSSLKIGRWFGIDVFVHPTFWLLPLLVVMSGAGNVPFELAALFGAFGCVALHEYGHALAARLFGIQTRDITLYPLGGVARLEGMPERPWPEIVVALAGPAVNVVIAAGLFGLLLIDGVIPGGGSAVSVPDALFARLMWVNLILAGFNLLPVFPMDGGRVFRALLSVVTDRVTATEVAVMVGTVLAGLMALAGLWFGQFMLVILAVFVVMMGRGELAGIRYQEEARRWEWQARRRMPVWEPVEWPADGWVYDPRTGLWTEWRGGVAVRRVRAD